MEDCTSSALVQSSDDSEASFHTAADDSTARDSGELTVTASEGNESTANESTVQTGIDCSPPSGAVLTASATNGTEDSATCSDDFKERTIESTTICSNSPPPGSNVTAVCVSDMGISTEDEVLSGNGMQCETQSTSSCGISATHTSANNPTVMKIAEEKELKCEVTSDVAPSTEERVPAAIVCGEERDNQVESNPQQIDFSVTNKNDDVIKEAMEVDVKIDDCDKHRPTSLSKSDETSQYSSGNVIALSTSSCGTSPALINSANNPTVMRMAEEKGLKQELTSDVAQSTEERVPATIVCGEERDNQVELNTQQIDFSVTNKNDDVTEEAMEVDEKIDDCNQHHPTSLSKNDETSRFSPDHCTNTTEDSNAVEDLLNPTEDSNAVKDLLNPTEDSNTVKDLSDSLNQDEQRKTTSSVRTAAVDGYHEESDVASLSSSVSHLEGGGRQETASVSSSGYGGSREASPDVGAIITDDMKEEEERLRERESPEGEAGELSHMKEYQRYMRLQHLLQKSSIYSKFLLERMENQIAEKKKSEKKKDQNQTTTAKKKKATEEVKTTRQGPRRSSRGKKRKADDSFQLSHFMDEKGKLKQMKLDKGNGVTQAVESTKKRVKEGEAADEKERYFKGVAVPQAQPKLMTGGVMRSYQVEGMEWIKVLYENGVNGILADEMGLGKTLQVIGVIAHLIEMHVKGPFLVAAPLSTLPNWVSEFKKFTPEIPVVLYHGTQMEREKLRRKMFKLKKKNGELDTLPVVVTSYEICMRDQRHLMYRNWKFLVVDEGHRIKNLNCKLIRALKSYDAANRLLLTGTPLQNNLAELWSLLNFILPDIFDDLNGFQSWFDFDVTGEDNREKIIAQEREQNVLSTLHQILTPFLLRRLKTDVEFSLPPKKEVLVYAPLTAVQQKYYTSLLDRTILEMVKGKEQNVATTAVNSELDAMAKDGECGSRLIRRRKSCNRYAELNDDQFERLLTGEKSYEELVTPPDEKEDKKPASRTSATNIKLTNVWMMLRKCCNHPYLLEFPMTPEGQFRVDEELVTSCGKLMLLDRLLPALIDQGHKTILFSQFTSMLDILEDYLELRAITYGRLDGQMPFTERQRQMSVFQGDPDCHIFLTSTRAGGLGLNLTAADTVIIYDSDWNPQADLQAQDRCHRIGQTKPVIVYRLVTANTFDQRIVERATSKRRLEKMVIHKGKFKGYSGQDQQLSLEDLTSLLQSVDHEKVVNSSDAIISDEALRALLDRRIQPVKESERRQEDDRQHDGIFKVIDEQDSSGNTLTIGCNSKCNNSDHLDSTSHTADSGKEINELSHKEIATEADVIGSNSVVTDIKV